MSDPLPSSDSSTPATSRREFLKTAALAGSAAFGFYYVPRHVLGGEKFVAPSDKVNVAMIGCGGRAQQNLRGVMDCPEAQVIAVADPTESVDMKDLRIYRTVAGRLPMKEQIEKHYAAKCPDYEDFRVMLDKQPEIDAVVVSTPDHQHAHGALTAMRQGKHTYCEKPLTHNIAESRLVAKVAKETGVATQMGNQGHSRDTMAQTVERVKGGVIGEIKEVHAWVPATRWNPGLTAPPMESMPVPKGMNWDLWLGPRAERPFHTAYAPVHWRDFWDFGCGALGDFACHDLDSATWALNLFAPTRIVAHNAGQSHPGLAPHGSICYFDFPKMGDQPEVKVTWYDGGLMPELPAAAESERGKYRRGVMFVGEKGIMLCQGAGGPSAVILNDGPSEFQEPEPTIPRVKSHYQDWIDACKGGRPALSNFEYGARLNEITLLGVLAVRSGKPLSWDHQSMTATGDDQAEAIILGDYRPGWELT